MNDDKKIVYILGTKAQFIKSKYVLINLMNLGMDIAIIDTGQHKEITNIELINSGLKYDYFSLTENNKNISTIPKMFFWFLKILFKKNKIALFKGSSFTLLHGDTLSTLIGLILAKLNKSKVIHLESGYKSNNIFKPFPEEIIRSLVSKFSEILVVDGKTQYLNILKYKGKKKIIEIKRNTIVDSLSNINSNKNSSNQNNSLIITVHRTENIYNRNRLNMLANLIIEISNKKYFERIEWFCHDVTKNALNKFNFIEDLNKHKIILNDLIPHDDFIIRLSKAKAVITDGGSIAEECSILGLNTVIWRDLVENKEYLGKNVILSEYNNIKIHKFLQNLPKRSKPNIETYSPSKELAEVIFKLVNEQ